MAKTGCLEKTLFNVGIKAFSQLCRSSAAFKRQNLYTASSNLRGYPVSCPDHWLGAAVMPQQEGFVCKNRAKTLPLVSGPSSGAPHLRAVLGKAAVHLELGLACLRACHTRSYCCHLCSCSFSMLLSYGWKMARISPHPLPNNTFIKRVFCTGGEEGLTEKLFKVRRKAKPSCSREIELWRSVGKGFLPPPHHNAVCLKKKKKKKL